MKYISILILIFYLTFSFGQGFNESVIEVFSNTDKMESFTGVEEKKAEWFKVKTVNLYGGGTLFSLVTSGKELENSTTPAGSLGLNLATNRLSSDIYFSYNGKKTIEMTDLSQFGNSLMNTDLGGQSFTFFVLGKLINDFGFSGKFQIAKNQWQIDSLTSVDASPLVARLGIYWNPFEFDLANNEVNFTLSAHYTHRSILGDFGNNEHMIGGHLIKKRGYNGLDFAATVYLNKVSLFVQISSNSKDDFDIPGFTGTQVTFGLNVTGEFVKLK